MFLDHIWWPHTNWPKRIKFFEQVKDSEEKGNGRDISDTITNMCCELR